MMSLNEPDLVPMFDEALIRLKIGWTQGAFARDHYSRDVRSSGNEPVEWCLLGSFGPYLFGDESYTLLGVIHQYLRAHLSRYPEYDEIIWTEISAPEDPVESDLISAIASWNDYLGRTAEEVIALMTEIRAHLLSSKEKPNV